MKTELIELYINNQKVILESETKMTEKKYLWENTQGDTIEGAGDNLQIVIPAIAPNQKIFNLRNYLEINKVYPLEFNCKLYYAGIKKTDGVFILTKIYKDKYEGFIAANSFNQFSDKYINDRDTFELEEYYLGTYPAEIVDNMRKISKNIFPQTRLQFPTIVTKDGFYSDNEFFGNILNDFYDDNYYYTNFYEPTDKEGASLFARSIIAIPFLKNVITQIFSSVGWNVTGDFLSHAAYSRLQILHNKPLDKIDIVPKFKFIGSYTNENWMWRNNYIPLFEDFDNDNCYDQITNFDYEFKQLGVYEFSFSADIKVPSIELTDAVIVSLKLTFDTIVDSYYTLFISDEIPKSVYNHISFKKIIEVDTKFINGNEFPNDSMLYEKVKLVLDAASVPAGFVTSIYYKNVNFQVRCLSHERINNFKGQFNLNELLPKITLSDFIKGIKEMFGVEVLFDSSNKIAEFKLITNVITDLQSFEIPATWIEYGNYFREFQSKIFAFKFDIASDYIKELDASEIVSYVDLYSQLPEVQVGKFAVVYSRNVIYKGVLIEQLEADPLKQWEEFCHYHFIFQSDNSGSQYKLKDYFKTDNTEEKFISAQPALMYGKSALVLPFLETSAESLAYNTGEQECNLKFMFDLGYDATYHYRVSSSMRWSNSLTPVVDRDLTWKSLFENNEEYYNFLRQSIKVTLYLKVTPGQYAQLLDVLNVNNAKRWLIEPNSKKRLLPIQVTSNLDNFDNIINVELVCLQQLYE